MWSLISDVMFLQQHKGERQWRGSNCEPSAPQGLLAEQLTARGQYWSLVFSASLQLTQLEDEGLKRELHMLIHEFTDLFTAK